MVNLYHFGEGENLYAQLELEETIPKINETKNLFFEKIKKIDKSFDRLVKKERGRTQINKNRNEKGEVTSDSTKIQRVIKDHYMLLLLLIIIIIIIINLEEMDKFLENCNLLRLNQEKKFKKINHK